MTEIHYTVSGRDAVKTVVTTDSCERKKSLQGDNYVQICFLDAEYIELPAGSYIIYENEKFSLIEDYRPRQDTSGVYTYDIRFSGLEEHFIKPIFFRYVRNDDQTIAYKEAEFSLYADLEETGKVIQEALQQVFPAPDYTWKISHDPSKKVRKTLSFAGQRFNDALTYIAREFETEWWIEKNPVDGCRTFHLEKCEKREYFRLSRFDLPEIGISRSLSSVDIPSGSERIPSRLYAYGSERNIVPVQNPENSLYRKRLQLPDGKEYIEVPGSSSGIEEIKFFDEIYPRRVGRITELRIVEKDGRHHYHFKDNELQYNEAEHRIEGLNPRILFESGALQGREFDVEYNSSTQEFYILPVTEGNLLLPAPGLAPFEGNDTDPGDAYVLFNIKMPDSYIVEAQKELYEKATEYAGKLTRSYPPVNCVTNEVYWASKNLRPEIGATVEIHDTRFPADGNKRQYLLSRITEYSYKLTHPFNISFTVAESLTEGRFTAIENKISEQNGRIDDVSRDTRIISRRGWRDAEELTGMIDSLRSDLLLIGNREGQFVTTFRFQANKDNDPNSLYISGGVLQHVVYKRTDDPDNEYGMWQHTNATLLKLPDPEQPYYLYACCPVYYGVCEIIYSTFKLYLKEKPDMYFFLLGTVSSVFDGKRTLNIVSGYTQIAGGSITTEKIQSPGGDLVIDLSSAVPRIEAKNGAEIKGNIVLTSGGTFEQINKIENEIDTLPPIIGRNYIKLSDQVHYALTDHTRDKYTISLFNIGDNGSSFNVRYTNQLNEPGIYTFSVTVNNICAYPTKVRIDITDQGSETVTIPANTMERISCTAKAYLGYPGNYGVFCDFSVIGEEGGDIHLINPKLEKGSRMTEWIPAPEDLEEETQRAIGKIERITDDNIFTIEEKKRLIPEWEAILDEEEPLAKTAEKYGIKSESNYYGRALSLLRDYVTPLISNLETDSTTGNSNFSPTDFRNLFTNFYKARNQLYRAIEVQAKILVDGLEIGGRNLLRNSGYFNSVTGWRAAGFNNNPVLTDIATIKAEIGTEFSSWAYLVNDTVLNDLFTLGKVYTATACLRANRSVKRYLQVITDTATHTVVSEEIQLSPSFQTFAVTFTVKAIPDDDKLYMRIGKAGDDVWQTGDWLEIKYFKLEQGHKSTGWSPAPEDIDEKFQESRYLLDTFAQGESQIDGGLVLTRFLGVRGGDDKVITGGLNGTRNSLPLIFAGAAEENDTNNSNLVNRAQNALFRVTGDGKLYALEGKISVFDMESFRLHNGEKGYRMVANSPQGQIEINPSLKIDPGNFKTDITVSMQKNFLDLNQDFLLYSFLEPADNYNIINNGNVVSNNELGLKGDIRIHMVINNIKVLGPNQYAIENGITKYFKANFRIFSNDGDTTGTQLSIPGTSVILTNRENVYDNPQLRGNVYLRYNLSIAHIFENVPLGKFRKNKPEGKIKLVFEGITLNRNPPEIEGTDLTQSTVIHEIVCLESVSPDRLTLRLENERILFSYNGLQISKSSGEYFYYRNKESGTDLGYNLGFKGTIDTTSNIPYLICGGSVKPDGSKEKVIGGTFHSTQGFGVGEYRIDLPDFMKNNEDYIVQLTVSGEWGGNGADNHANFSRRDTVNNCFYVKTYNGSTLENAGFTFMVYKADKKDSLEG